MIKTFTQRMCATLIGVAILSACSRPVAYFQRSPIESATTLNTPAVATVTPGQVISIPIEPGAQVTEAIKQIDAYVRNDSKLAADKKLSRRMERVKNLLASTHKLLDPTTTHAPRRVNLVERLMLKKIDKQIKQQLAPANPGKAMLNNSYLLGGGIVLLIAGLLLLILGTGTGAFIGLIIALVGALGLLLGLFGY